MRRTPLAAARAQAAGSPRRSFAAALLALALVPAGARAWELKRAPDGQPRRFTSFPLQLRVVTPPPGMQLVAPFDWLPAVQAALFTWQAEPGAAVPVRYAGRLTAPPPGAIKTGEVVLSFDQATFPGGPDVAGLTELFEDPLDPHAILSARVHLNARDFAWTSAGKDGALDVQTVALHELGHALGLAHPCGDQDTLTPSCDALPLVTKQEYEAAVMWPTIRAGARHALTPDDQAAVAAAAPAPVLQPAPSLDGVTPGCTTTLAGKQLTLHSSLPELAGRLQLQLDGVPLLEAPVVAGASGGLTARLPIPVTPLPLGPLPSQLDALLLSSSSKKAALLPAALLLATSCDPTGGCASAGAPGLAALLLLPLFSRRRRALRRPGRAACPRWPRPPRRSPLAAAAFVSLLLLAPLPAHAYKRSQNAGGLYTFWSTRGHTFQIDARGTPDVVGTAAFEAIRRGFLTWSSVSCSDLVFPDLGLSENPADRRIGYVPGGFNRNLVLFRTANCAAGAVPAGDPCLADGICGNKYDCWAHPSQVIATTTTTSNRFTGQIVDSDIEFNDAPSPDGTRFVFTAVDSPPCGDQNQVNCVHLDIQNTATHEIGHSIGLDHSSDPTATMYATAPDGETAKRTLHPDDVQAVCDIYPKGARTSTGLGDPITITPVAQGEAKGCGCNAAGAAPAAQGAALVLLAFSLRLRRRRVRPSPPCPPCWPRWPCSRMPMARLAAPTAALFVLLLAAAPGVRADASAAPTATVDTFTSALREGNPTRLLAVWPRTGSVKLYGEQVDHEAATSRARYDDGVFELMRWPRDGEKGAQPTSVEAAEKKAKRWTVTPEGKSSPVCTLRSKKGGPVELVECVEKK